MYFPISDTTVNPAYLIGLGFIIGILGGFFGVGGSFLAGPALFLIGLRMNFVVGTDLLHIVGKSIVAARKHNALGNIDMRLACIMVVGTIAGSEAGVQAIEALKRATKVDLVVGVATICVLTLMSFFIFLESWQALKLKGSPSAFSGTILGFVFAFAVERTQAPKAARRCRCTTRRRSQGWKLSGT